MDTFAEVAAWTDHLTTHSILAPASIRRYTRDADAFVRWLFLNTLDHRLSEVTAGDAREYRDALLAAGHKPATINRIRISLALLLDAHGHQTNNPFRRLRPIEEVKGAPKALRRVEWNAVRRAAEHKARRDHGLALALVSLMRYAGLRVGEVAALQLPDVLLSPRRGRVIVRLGKGLKRREVPLVLDVREPLEDYLMYRRQLAERWRQRRRAQRHPVPPWSAWPEGHLFLGQRGPLRERGIRDIVTRLGEAAKLDTGLFPHALRHTFATALLDPHAYGFDRPAAPLTAVQDLLGHADPATTARYTHATHADLARIMGEPADAWY